jgi:hypothetical protein
MAKKLGGYKGFKSKKQWRWAFANMKTFAHKKAHETKGGWKALPKNK